MIYVEYISRRPGIALSDFHGVVRQVQDTWEKGHGRDRLIVNAGRTWRIGPEPEYLGVWDTGESGFERLDQWTGAFDERGEVGDEATMSRVARIDFAGCYDALLEPVRTRNRIYYVEQFLPMGSREQIRSAYLDRAHKHPALQLSVAAHRIGRLAPEPGGLAIWSLPNFASLAEIARELDECTAPMQLTCSALYADIGHEIL